MVGVFGEEFMGEDCAIIPFGYDISKRAAAIDPKLPLLRHCLSSTFVLSGILARSAT